MILRKARPEDLPEILRILEEAKITIGALGIDQWQKGYPNEASIREDLEKKRSYVAEAEGTVCGTFVLVTDEPTYRVIDGAWLSGTENREYYALHRVAVACSHRGTGVAEAIVAHAKKEAKRRGFISLRIDTHEGNLPMRKMLTKNGFTPCGTIRLANGDPRIAYEIMI